MRPALLTLLLLALPIAADEPPDPFAKLPLSGKAAYAEYLKTLAEAQRVYDAAARGAAADLAAELTRLQKEATKGERLDEAVTPRDAAKAVGENGAVPKAIAFDRDDKSNTLTLNEKGFRWADWPANKYGPWKVTPFGGIVLYHQPGEKMAGKPWAYLVATLDRSAAMWWDPVNGTVLLHAKK